MSATQPPADAVEAVARAICESMEADVWDELSVKSIYRAAYIQQAHAAIAAFEATLRPAIIAEERAATVAWQPIETAPKDGTEIDLWSKTGRGYRVPDCRWLKDEWVTRGDKGWEPLVNFKLTHWQPLPKPPGDHEQKGPSRGEVG